MSVGLASRQEREFSVTGAEVAVGLLITWVLRKAGRAARRADGAVDQAVDAGVDRVGELILTKLGGDPAVDRLQVEAGEQGTVSDRTAKRVELAVEEAAEQDLGSRRRWRRQWGRCRRHGPMAWAGSR
jgi:hypothetical protein